MKSRVVEAATLRPHTQAVTVTVSHDKHTNPAVATTYLLEFDQPKTPEFSLYGAYRRMLNNISLITCYGVALVHYLK